LQENALSLYFEVTNLQASIECDDKTFQDHLVAMSAKMSQDIRELSETLSNPLPFTIERSVSSLSKNWLKSRL